MEEKLKTYLHDSHQIAYREWGEPDNPQVLICVHGLTRNSKDFDSLAQILRKDYRLICPDLLGHGKSDWLANPDDYHIDFYVKDMLTLLQALNLDKVNWLGTSLGGMIGMKISGENPRLIQRLILNDIGVLIPQSALREIAKYLRLTQPKFNGLEEAETYIRYYYQSFGNLTDEQWRIFTENTLRPLSDGGYTLHHDSHIGDVFPGTSLEGIQDVSLEEIWQKITCPVLVLRGEDSDFLLPETIIKMKENHPQMTVINFANCGHAPALMDQGQIQEIEDWLYQTGGFQIT